MIDSVLANCSIAEALISFVEPNEVIPVSKAFCKAALQSVTPKTMKILKSNFFAAQVQSLDLSFTKSRPLGDFSLQNIRRLNLSACHWIDNDILLEISSSKISDLNLYWCISVTDEAVSNLISRNPEIEILVLSGCNKLTDATMRTVAAKLPRLKIFDVTRCPLVTDAGLSEICESPIRETLTELNLYAKVQNIDPSFYPKIGNFSRLRSLDLCGHLKLTDLVMASLVSRLPELRRLNLSWCVEVGDLTVAQLSSSKVTWLSLFGIKKISAACIEEFLEKRGRFFEALDIRGIPNVRHLTVSDCAELRVRAPWLREWKIHT